MAREQDSVRYHGLRCSTSVGMVVGICLVAGMCVLMNSVFSLMSVVVAAGFRIVNVLVGMPVLVLMLVSMSVLMRMCLAPVVGMLVSVGMLVLVTVDMVVFVSSLHVGLLLCDRTRRVYL